MFCGAALDGRSSDVSTFQPAVFVFAHSAGMNEYIHTYTYTYTYTYIYIYMYIYIYTENNIIQAPVFGGSHIYVLCSFVHI